MCGVWAIDCICAVLRIAATTAILSVFHVHRVVIPFGFRPPKRYDTTIDSGPVPTCEPTAIYAIQERGVGSHPHPPPWPCLAQFASLQCAALRRIRPLRLASSDPRRMDQYNSAALVPSRQAMLVSKSRDSAFALSMCPPLLQIPSNTPGSDSDESTRRRNSSSSMATETPGTKIIKQTSPKKS